MRNDQKAAKLLVRKNMVLLFFVFECFQKKKEEMNQLVGWFGSLCPSLRSSSGDLLGDLVACDGVLLLEIASKLCGRPVIPKATPQAFK